VPSDETIRLVLGVVNAVLNLVTLVYVHHVHRDVHSSSTTDDSGQAGAHS
jgi:hypothetical protein